MRILQIRLVLPSLGTCDKEEGSSSAVKRSNPGDLSGKPAESAAALAKARKKLLKIQGIASQADKAHSSVIVDLGVLAGEAAAGEEQAAAQGRGQASNATSIAAGRSSESVGPREKRSSKQGAAAGTAPAAGAGSPSSQLKPRTAAASGDSVKRLSSRLAPSSPSAAAGDASADSTGGSCGSRSAVASSRNKGQPDKPYVPIWERLLPPTALAEEKKVAATAQRVLQPVALKTFSPTLGSLGGGLAQQGALAPACFTYWPFASTSFMPFRLLHHMRRHGTLSAQVHAWQGCLGCF
ncbi:hypothetical protein COO60DRAFT_149257 [Scenedesmus sp. NREL 46B-D3]|nr:hypothetical protein COO60DRAFT_149257 [Scenedesmus sp. NREL 46B-D3]